MAAEARVRALKARPATKRARASPLLNALTLASRQAQHAGESVTSLVEPVLMGSLA
jgi:hypothetical protein